MKLPMRAAGMAGAALLAALSILWLAWLEKPARVAASPLGVDAERAARQLADASIEPPIEIEAQQGVSREDVALTGAKTGATETKPALLRVLVLAKEDGRPVANVRVRACPDGEDTHDVAASHGGVGEDPLTNAEGRAEHEVEAGKALRLVLIAVRSPFVTEELEALAAGETRDLELVLPTREDVRLFGRLVDAQDEAPLVGRVSILKPAVAACDVESDAGGFFELSARSWERAFASARAEDHAEVLFAITEGYGDPARPLLVRLSRAASVEAFVHDPSGGPIAGAKVSLTTPGYALEQRMDERMPVDFYGFPDPVWSANTDGHGRVAIEGLPPQARLHLSVSAEDWPARDQVDPLELEPGEHRTLDLALGAGATIVGTLEDTSGTRIAEREMWLMPLRMTTPGPGMFQRGSKPSRITKTDAQGRFEFRCVPADTWWVGPSPQEPSLDGIPSAAELLIVSDETALLEIVVRVERGLCLQGQVLDSLDAPVSWAQVRAGHSAGHAWVSAMADEQGHFSVGPLIAGTWRLQAMLPGRAAPSEVVEVEAGSTGIELRMDEGGSIAGEVVDSGTGERCACSIDLVPLDAAVKGYSSTGSSPEGFGFDGLAPGTYTVFADAGDGRIGVQSGVAILSGTRIENLRIEIAPAAQLLVRYSGAAEYVSFLIYRDGVPIRLTGCSRGKVQTVYVPPGAIELRWRENLETATEHVETISIGPRERREVTLQADS